MDSPVRLISTTVKDGAYTVTISGLGSWQTADLLAQTVAQILREAQQIGREAAAHVLNG